MVRIDRASMLSLAILEEVINRRKSKIDLFCNGGSAIEGYRPWDTENS